MTSLKSLKLLGSLSGEELDDFQFVINSSRRESLKKLYTYISARSIDDINKGALFRAAFGKTYTKEKDYLLRNELRLLNEQLKEFLVLRQYREEGKANPAMASFMLQKALLKQGMPKEYEAEFKRGYQLALNTLNFDVAHKMLNEHFNYLMTHKEITLQLIDRSHDLLKENVKNIKLRYRTEIASNQQGRSAMEAYMKVFGQQVEASLIGADTDVEGFSNPYIRFWEYTSKANNSSGEEKIKYTQLADSNIAEVGEVFPHVRVDALAKLAGGYYLTKRYKEAKPYYQEALDFSQKHKLVIRNDILYNYCNALMHLEEYENALQLMQEHDWHIRNNAKTKNKFAYLKAFALIYLGRHKQVAGTIPQDLRKLPEDELQNLRFIYCILPYLNQDMERAIRESINFIAYFNHHGNTLTFGHEKYFVQLFKTFYETLSDMPGRSEQRNKVLAQLTRNLDGLLKEYPQHAEYQYVLWLRKEINKAVY